MNKFRINNIYNDNGKTLDEVISNFLLNFLDNELNFIDFCGIIKLDTILNN
ncbi:MAG: hypothetical protein J6B64_03155 [Bacilli bacterium]|nr:hypothetical protein [Bacilli bacterium]MBO5376380.1 hypothetical protein [Bacilli bacterium]